LNATTQTPFVGNLAVAGQSIQGEAVRPMVIQKLVSIPRGLRVDLQDPASGRSLPFVPAPGVAKVLFDASGIANVMLENWQELKVDPTLTARNAKSRNELITEIAQDLFADGGARIANVSAHIVYGSDWRGTFGYLVPAVRVYVAPASGNLNNDQLKQILHEKIGTAGIVVAIGSVLRPRPVREHCLDYRSDRPQSALQVATAAKPAERVSAQRRRSTSTWTSLLCRCRRIRPRVRSAEARFALPRTPGPRTMRIRCRAHCAVRAWCRCEW
jgi:hypothetical protein